MAGGLFLRHRLGSHVQADALLGAAGVDAAVAHGHGIPAFAREDMTARLFRVRGRGRLHQDEIAGIMGHELTHVRQQHWARLYSNIQKRQLFMTAALIFLRVNYTGAQLADLASGLLDLRYSRDDEATADQGGFDNSTTAGYNPQGLADAFTMLDKLGGRGPEILSDHPSNTKRIHHIEDDIKRSGKVYPPQRLLPWATAGP